MRAKTTDSNLVTVYGREGCARCENTMCALDLAGIPAVYVDVDRDTGARAELEERGVRELPLVVTATESWTGLRIDKIVALRRIRRAA